MNEQEILLSDFNHKTLKKKVLIPGDLMSPLDGAECQVNISEIEWKTESCQGQPDENSLYFNKDFSGSLTIGSASLYIDIDLERCVQRMNTGETSLLYITYLNKSGNEALQVTCKLQLIAVIDNGLFCDWHWEKKISHATVLKESAVELIKSNRIIDAFRQFSKSLKYVLSLDSVEFKTIDDRGKMEIRSLKIKLYNNLAFCQLQFNEFQAVVSLCGKVLAEEPANVKALYRRGTALMGLADYEAAYADICQVLTIEPKNPAAQQKAAVLREKVIHINQAYKKVIKSMFV